MPKKTNQKKVLPLLSSTRFGLEFIIKAGHILSSSLDYDVTLASVANLAVTYISDICVIDLIQKDGTIGHVTVTEANHRRTALSQKILHSPPNPDAKQGIYEVAKTGRPLLISPVTEEWIQSVKKTEEDVAIYKEMNLKSQMLVPLICRGKVIGVLWLASRDIRRMYNEEDLLWAEELANRAAIAVDNARLYREAQDAVRMRDEFLSIASHELKTPLTSITLQLQMALKNIGNRRKMPREKIAKVLEGAESQAEKLQKLINDLLNVSLITTGRIQLEKEKTDFSELVSDTIERFDHSLKRNKYEIKKSIAPKVVGKMDRVRVEQVVANLITNAIKYGAKKPISINVTEKNGNAVLIVKDNGIGILEKHQDEIFERFARGVNAKEYRGLGVGLYISSQIVEAHGGRIGLKSTPNKGSTFTVTLPLR